MRLIRTNKGQISFKVGRTGILFSGIGMRNMLKSTGALDEKIILEDALDSLDVVQD